MACGSCEDPDASYKCKDCFQTSLQCQNCCLLEHHHLPFHRIQRWNGRYFERDDLSNLGLVLDLEHDRHSPCNTETSRTNLHDEQQLSDFTSDDEDEAHPPLSTSRSLKSNLIVVSSSGIFTRAVRWCQCANSAGYGQKRVQLLLRAKLYPASFHDPKTVFTFEVLDHFRIDALECKTAAMNFMNKIKRMTREAFPDEVPVSWKTYEVTSADCKIVIASFQDRYRELLRVSRQWRDIHNRMRSGVLHDRIDRPSNGEMAIFCPACPQIGINVTPDELEGTDRYVVNLRRRFSSLMSALKVAL